MKYYHTPPYFINSVHRITVNLIGVGGTGSLILTRLARLHYALNQLGHAGLYVVAFDDDKVEPFNVGRQMFTPYDIGSYKSEVIIEKVNYTFGLDWKAIPKKYKVSTKTDNEKFANITISAVDNIKVRTDLKTVFDTLKNEQLEHKFNYQPYFMPHLWLDCGNSRTSGQFVLSTVLGEQNNVLNDVIELYGDLKQFDTKEIQGASCSYSQSIKEQDLFINDAISLYAVDLLWKLFRDKKIAYQGGFINTNNLQSNPIKIAN